MNFQRLQSDQRARNAVFLDTNIFVLLVVGSLSPQLLKQSKRTQQFSEDDFKLLLQFLRLFRTIRTTAPVITETCNLLDTLNTAQQQRVFGTIAKLLTNLRERHVPSIKLSSLPAFASLGLADTSLLSGATGGAVVVTDDLKFFSQIRAMGLLAVNFNHLRTENWFS